MQDLGITKRHNKSLKEYEELLTKLIKRSKLPEIKINTEEIFTYQNTKSPTTMGLIVIEFEMKIFKGRKIMIDLF